MTISELVSRANEQAKAKGFFLSDDNVPEMIALIHSEASEALECHRNGEDLDYVVEGKPMGIASEFADIVIRVGHYSAVLGIDLENAICRKLAFNRTREYRHGNKKC